jgi:transposase InsO family protein
VWCSDITYIQMQRGFLYLVAIMDWASRKVLAWRLSNTMDTEFCIEALEEALAKYGTPEIFNSDQGGQFTSPRFTGILKEAGVKISMGGKGRWMDNVFIERLWRSLKYECVYLLAFESGAEARNGIEAWMKFYGAQRPAFGTRRADARRGVRGLTPPPGSLTNGGRLSCGVGMRDRILEAARWSIATQGPYASRCRDVKRCSYSTARIGAQLAFTMQNSSGVQLEAVFSTFPSSNFPHARQNLKSLVADASLLL